MFVAIRNKKIIDYNRTGEFPLLNYDEVKEVDDVTLVQVNGELVHRVYMDQTNAKRDYYGVRVNGIEFLTPKPKEEKKEEKKEIVDDRLPF